MKKLVVIATILSVITGCAKSTIKNYEHSEYGVGNAENPYFVKDRTDCKNDEYSKGLLINGDLIKDVELIEKFEDEYNKWMVDEAVKAVRSSGSGAYAGSTAAVAVTTGNTSNLNGNYSNQKILVPPTPEKYQDLERSRKDRINCLIKKGWNKPK